MKNPLRWFHRRREFENAMSEELRFHVEQQTAKNIAAGMTREQAQRQARLQLGAVEGVKSECREERRGFVFESIWADVRYGLRTLRKSPGFTVVAVLTLALGIGANTAIFSVVNAVLVRQLPFRDSARLAAIFQAPEKSNGPMGWAASGPDILDWQRDSRSFAPIAATLMDEANLTGGSTPLHLTGEKVTPNYFELLGAQASVGRTFIPDSGNSEQDAANDRQVILSYSVWREFFGSRDILGQTIQLDEQPFVVIGVMPATFHDPRTWMNPESHYWIPLPHEQLAANRGEHMYAVFGRLAPGVTLSEAQQEMDAIGAHEAQQFPNTNEGMGVRVSSLQEVNLQTYEEGRFQSVAPAILLLQISVGFLLLIACANVSSLMLSRVMGRQSELAVRAALGAGRWRLVRQLLTESLLISFMAGAAGVLLAIVAKGVLIGMAPRGYLPATADIGLDFRILAFTLGASTLCGILFGLFPAFRAARSNIGDEMKGTKKGAADSGRMPGVRRALVVLELATTFLLLVGGGLMIRSLGSLLAVNPGFAPRNFFTGGVSLPAERYAKPEQIVRFFSQAQDRISAIPGVEAASFTSAPEFAVTNSSDVVVEGFSEQGSGRANVWPQICLVTPAFFRAAGISLLEGRDFSAGEIAHPANVVIVSQAFAEYFWPKQNPLGKHVSYGGQKNWREVIGVVENIRQEGLAAASLPEIYMPFASDLADGYTSMNVVARSSLPPDSLAQSIREQIWAIDGEIPLSEVRTGDQILGEWAGYLRFRAMLLGTFAAIALLIAVIGVFGAISYTTSQRAHEFGIRMALGAQRRDVVRLVLVQGAGLVLLGLAIGIAGALALSRLMVDLLYGVKPSDPFTFVGVSLLLAIVALVACYIPAYRAMRVDPVNALRCE